MPACTFALRLVVLTALIVTAATVRPASQTSTTAYTIYSPAGRRTLPFRTTGGVDIVALDQVAAIFSLKVAEDTLVGGLTIEGRGQTILLIPGQSFVSVGPGRVVSLPGPVRREGSAWFVPIEFVRQALGPALGVPVDIRRGSRLVIVGDVRVPRVTGRVERLGTNARIVFEVEPPTPVAVGRETNRLVVRFEATALDLPPITGFLPEFAPNARVEGTSIVFTLGPAVADHRVTGAGTNRVTVDLLTAAPSPVPTAPRPADRPLPSLPAPGSIRTIVLDPGHGGEDAGTRGANGTVEKTLVLDLARRLKAGIEGRFGFRVLLTREGDENVPVDRRTSLANNNKADLFISLHANASVRPGARGAQVMSLSLEDYRRPSDAAGIGAVAVPLVGGGSRMIDAMPWDLAQLPFAEASATLAGIAARHLGERGVTLFSRPVATLPLRSLVGANMPAILVETGFLSNAEDERFLTSPDRSSALIDALLTTIGEVREGVPAIANGPGGAP